MYKPRWVWKINTLVNALISLMRQPYETKLFILYTSSKTGVKVGVKIGVKIGVEISAKTGVKIRAKIGVKIGTKTGVQLVWEIWNVVRKIVSK